MPANAIDSTEIGRTVGRLVGPDDPCGTCGEPQSTHTDGQGVPMSCEEAARLRVQRARDAQTEGLKDRLADLLARAHFACPLQHLVPRDLDRCLLWARIAIRGADPRADEDELARRRAVASLAEAGETGPMTMDAVRDHLFDTWLHTMGEER